MKRFVRLASLTVALASAFALAQAQTPTPAQAQTPAPAQEQPKAAQPQFQAKSQEEYNDFIAITSTAANEERAKKVEEFFTKYPEAGLAPYVHQIAATTYQQLNNFDKLVFHAEKALTIWPENPQSPVLMMVLANAYSERNFPDKALDRAQKSIAAIEKMEKPAQVADAVWNQQKPQLLATNHAAMGVAYLTKYQNQPKAAKPEGDPPQAGTEAPVDPTLQLAIESLNKAVSLNPKDDFAAYRLGIAYTMANKAEAAINAYARAVALEGYVSAPAKEKLEAVYKMTHNNTLDGLADVIKKAKDELAAPPPTSASPPPAA